MARKRLESEPQSRTYVGEAAPLPIKYHPRALMPCQVTRYDVGHWQYLTTDGVRVRLEYRGVFDNSNGWNSERLEAESQKLYGMSFATIEAVWAHRIGLLDGMWNIVHLIKVDATDAK